MNRPTTRIDPLGLDPSPYQMMGFYNPQEDNAASITQAYKSFIDTVEQNARNETLNRPAFRVVMGTVQPAYGASQLAKELAIEVAELDAAEIPFIGQIAGPWAMGYSLSQLASGANNFSLRHGKPFGWAVRLDR